MLKLILLLVFVIPPPHPSAVKKLSEIPNRRSLILKSAQNKAPIPDSLKDRFIEVESFETASGIEMVLEVEETSELVRLSGPSYTWPHGNCYMCLGNYMISHFGQSKDYLDEIGYENWGILYDNLQNDPEFEGVKGKNEGWYQNSGSSGYSRRGILGRFFRR